MSLMDAAMSPSSPEASILQSALTRALDAIDAPLGNIQLIDWRDGGELRIAEQRGFDEEFLASFASVTSNSPCACGRALLFRKPVVVGDVHEEEAFASLRPFALRAGFRSVASVPMLASGGAMLGVISAHAPAAFHFADRELGVLQIVGHATADALIRHRANALHARRVQRRARA